MWIREHGLLAFAIAIMTVAGAIGIIIWLFRPIRQLPTDQPIDWYVVVSTNRHLERDAPLINSALRIAMEHWIPGDYVALYNADGELSFSREIQDEHHLNAFYDALNALRFDNHIARLSDGLMSAFREMNHRPKERGKVLIYATDGIVRVPTNEHERAMRALAEACRLWRESDASTIVLGIITQPECHWNLRQIQMELRGQLVLVRSTRQRSLRNLIASTVGRAVSEVRKASYQVARQPSAERPSQVSSRKAFDIINAMILVAIIALVLLAVVMFIRQHRGRTEVLPEPFAPEVEVPTITDIVHVKIEERFSEGEDWRLVPELSREFEILPNTQEVIRIGADLGSEIQLPNAPSILPTHVTLRFTDEDEILELASGAEIKAPAANNAFARRYLTIVGPRKLHLKDLPVFIIEPYKLTVYRSRGIPNSQGVEYYENRRNAQMAHPEPIYRQRRHHSSDQRTARLTRTIRRRARR